MTPQERRIALRQAQVLIEAVASSMNTEMKPCCINCGAERAINWGELKAKEVLAGVAHKLERMQTSGVCQEKGPPP